MDLTRYGNFIPSVVPSSWKVGMSDSQLDVLINSGAFISALMFESMNSFKETEDCLDDSFCKYYGVALILTTLIWFLTTFMAIYVRIYSYKFLLVQYLLRVTQIVCMFLTLITINMAAWFRNDTLIGKVAGYTVGSTTTFISCSFMGLFMFDFIMRKATNE